MSLPTGLQAEVKQRVRYGEMRLLRPFYFWSRLPWPGQSPGETVRGLFPWPPFPSHSGFNRGFRDGRGDPFDHLAIEDAGHDVFGA